MHIGQVFTLASGYDPRGRFSIGDGSCLSNDGAGTGRKLRAFGRLHAAVPCGVIDLPTLIVVGSARCSPEAAQVS